MKIEEFEVMIPNLEGTCVAERVKVSVPLRWDEELQEWLLTPEAHEMIENTKARRVGLLLPAQLNELRKRLGLTQKELSELLQIGEKTWTRWETGRERPSRSINVLLCALNDGRIDVAYLRDLAHRRANWAERSAPLAGSFWNAWTNAFQKCWQSADEKDLARWLSTTPIQVPSITEQQVWTQIVSPVETQKESSWLFLCRYGQGKTHLAWTLARFGQFLSERSAATPEVSEAYREPEPPRLTRQRRFSLDDIQLIS